MAIGTLAFGEYAALLLLAVEALPRRGLPCFGLLGSGSRCSPGGRRLLHGGLPTLRVPPCFSLLAAANSFGAGFFLRPGFLAGLFPGLLPGLFRGLLLAAGVERIVAGTGGGTGTQGEDGWRSDYRNSFGYRDASYGYYGYYLDQDQYRYYFRQGFRRGYEDGYYGRYRYGRRNDDGTFVVLAAVLAVILGLELLD